MANSTKTKFQEYTQYLIDAFVRNTRSQDCVDLGIRKKNKKKNYNHADKDEIQQNLIQPLHDEEWPNDWRYSTIYFLLLDFVECEDRDEVEDRRFQIVDGLVDVYNADRVRWLGENLNRGLE